jgi:flagellar basal body-associated protein FliL
MALQKNRNEHSETSSAKTRSWSSIIVIVVIIAVAAGIAFLLTRRGAETKETDSLSVETISSPQADQAAAPISPIASNEQHIETLDDWEVDATQAQEVQETEALVMEANAFYDQGDYEKAIELLTISIDVSE